METSTRNRSSSSQGTTFQSHFQRSLSPSGRFCSSSMSTSSSTAFSTPPRTLHRPISPTRVTLNNRSVSPSSTVRFSRIASHHNQKQQSHHRSLSSNPKKTCMCSPTTHPGSFRCSLHKNNNNNNYRNNNKNTASYGRSSQQLNMVRSAMTNSLVRIGTVEGDLVRRALAALIRPSSHSLRRRGDFQPRPSRLSVMSKAGL